MELPTTAGALGALFGAEILGDPERPVSRLSPLHLAGQGALSFLAHSKFSDGLTGAEGAVIFTKAELAEKGREVTYLIVADPQSSFSEVARHFRAPFPWKGISPQAIVSPDAVIDPTAHIGPQVCIGAGARIGARSVVYPLTYIGSNVVIGEDVELHARVTLYDGVRLGNRIRVLSGAVIGGDGFGYFRENNQGPYQEMPQIGSVRVEDDVRIGANVTIDRATLTETVIRRGSKLDDQVHVGHNADVGEDCILCAQTALGGSVVLENDVVCGGQSGLGHGVRVGSGARLGGQCGATTNVPGNDTYTFMPAIASAKFMRIYRALNHLPKLAERVRGLERRLGEKSDA